MCGISVAINKKNEAVEKNLIEGMSKLIEHRGPDSEGFYFWNNVALAHRRLSILDLSTNGAQPMNFTDKYTIVYNGEVFNYLELQIELTELGYNFHSNSDTEVILAAYDFWGVDCLDRFNGMWSFCLLDKIKKVLFCSRDRFGVKPFYFHDGDDYFTIGSEIKQLLPNLSEIRANREVVTEFLFASVDNHSEKTYFENITCLLPGHYLLINLTDNTREQYQYYNLEERINSKSINFSEAQEAIKSTFVSSVDIRLRSDVPVGMCLSGGLDSSAIAAFSVDNYLKKEIYKSFCAIHAQSTESDSDELDSAQKVARYLNIDLNVVTPKTEDFVELIDEVVYTQEEPFGGPSLFMGYSVFRKAKELGLKVMLNGQGGDEVLLGYERYFSSYLYSLPLVKRIKEWYLQAQNTGLGLSRTFKYYCYFSSFRIRKWILIRRSYLKKSVLKKHDFSILATSVNSFRDLDKLQLIEITKIQLPHLLRYEDRNSMRHSVETRLPFLDYRFVEACLSIPVNFKLKNGWTKFVLRKILKGFVPNEIIWRKNKLGFNAPEETWITHHLVEMKNEIGNSKILREIVDVDDLLIDFNKISLKDKWKYYNVAVWERVFHVV